MYPWDTGFTSNISTELRDASCPFKVKSPLFCQAHEIVQIIFPVGLLGFLNFMSDMYAEAWVLWSRLEYGYWSMFCHGAGQSNTWRNQPTLWLVNFATFILLDEANKFVPCLRMFVVYN
jgi:hypothetical protein